MVLSQDRAFFVDCIRLHSMPSTQCCNRWFACIYAAYAMVASS